MISRTKMIASTTVATLVSLAAFSATADAAPIGVDGTIGAEWTGANVVHVPYSATGADYAFNGGPVSDTVAYDIYTRADSTYVYVALKADPAGSGNDAYDPSLTFTNLYFGTVYGSGSNAGFEVFNNRAFRPGVPGYYNIPTSGPYQMFSAQNTPAGYSAPGGAVGTIDEVAIPWSFFQDDPGALGFTPISGSNTQLTLRLSQTFGFGVAGGSTFGPDRLGVVAVPEPSSLGALAVGGLTLLARRRRAAR